MTLHIFPSSSHNKNSLFCSCLDSGGGWRGVGKEGRNRDPIQRTDQHDRSLERALSPSSEWQLVKPQRLAQPLLSSHCLSFYLIYYSDRLLSASSFSLISSSVYPLLPGSLLLPHLVFFPPSPMSILSLCVFAFSLPSSGHPLSPALLLSFFLSSNTPIQLSHEFEAKL